jgi:hypothetical protein
MINGDAAGRFLCLALVALGKMWWKRKCERHWQEMDEEEEARKRKERSNEH